MGIKVANNAFGTLAASITNSDTSITLTTGQGARFPSLGAGDYFYATLIDTSNNLEIVKCTARSTDVLTVTRAQESTTARAYSAGDRIEIRITAQTFLDAAAIPDGDKGDITTSSSGATWTIDNGAIVEAKIANGAVTAAKLASTLDLTGKTVTLPAGVGGKVLQVVSTLFTTQTSRTSNTYADISGFSASITPSSASNKIFVILGANFSHAPTTGGIVQLKRNGTAVPRDPVFWFYAGDSNTAYSGVAAVVNYLDSPATTSSLTYQIAWKVDVNGAAIWINRSPNYPNTGQSGMSSITLMEIAA